MMGAEQPDGHAGFHPRAEQSRARRRDDPQNRLRKPATVFQASQAIQLHAADSRIAHTQDASLPIFTFVRLGTLQVAEEVQGVFRMALRIWQEWKRSPSGFGQFARIRLDSGVQFVIIGGW